MNISFKKGYKLIMKQNKVDLKELFEVGFALYA